MKIQQNTVFFAICMFYELFLEKSIMRDIYENFDVITRNKKVILWGITIESGEIFRETLNQRIAVTCFVDITGDFQYERGKRLFGKPVLTKEDLLVSSFTRETSFILAAEQDISTRELEWFNKYFKDAYYICSVSNIDAAIKMAKKLYIYGAGSSGKRTWRLLGEQGIHVNAFIDNDSAKWDKKIDDNAIEASVYEPKRIRESDTVIISSQYYPEIKEALLKQGIPEKKIYIDIRNSGEFSENPLCYEKRRKVWFEYTKLNIIKGIEWEWILWIALMDLYDKKKIILYGVNEFTLQFIGLFSLMNIEVIYCIDKISKVDAMEILGGGSLKEMLPFLSKFLGHTSPEETLYYYHQVDFAFRIIRSFDKTSAKVIPEVTKDE